jgi:hypothetical protein
MINRDHSQDQILGMNALSLYCTCWCGYLSYVKQATCPPTTLNQLRDGTHPLKFVPTRSWWLTMSNQKYGRGYICFAIIVFCCCMIQPSVFLNNSHCLIIWRSIVKYSQLSQLGFLSKVRLNWHVLLASSPSCMRPLSGEMMKDMGNLNIGRSWGIGREKGVLSSYMYSLQVRLRSYLHLVV